MGTKRDEEEEDGSTDRISELPQHISHQILSHLSQKKATRTCVLSKTWRDIVSTRPKIKFRDKWFARDKETLHSVLDTTLQRYHDQKLHIGEFFLQLSYDDDDDDDDDCDVSQSISLLLKWVPIILLLPGLEVFSLSLLEINSNNLRELVLEGCRISNKNIVDNKVLFRHLDTLSLSRFDISDKTFEKIMSSFPLINYFVLHLCDGLKTINIANNKRPNLIDFFCAFLEDKESSIKIDHVPAIEIIGIRSCSNLVSLDMDLVKLDSKSLDIFSSDFPCLEKLRLRRCYGFRELKLLTRSIKHLTIMECKLIEVTIDAPNILSFEYTSCFLPSSISFTTTSSEWKSEINVCYSRINGDGGVLLWLLKLNGLLKALSQSHVSMNLWNSILTDGQRVEDANICGGFYEHVVVEHLTLRGKYSCSSFPAFLNLLFCTCRPRNLEGLAESGSNENRDIHHHLFKSLVQERETRDKNYFWQQDLEQVIAVTSNDHGKTWHPVAEETSLTNKINTCKNTTRFRFRLKWR